MDKLGPPKVDRCRTITEGSTVGVEPAAVTGVIKWVTGGGSGTAVTLGDAMRCCQEVGPGSALGMGLKCQISPYSSIRQSLEPSSRMLAELQAKPFSHHIHFILLPQLSKGVGGPTGI